MPVIHISTYFQMAEDLQWKYDNNVDINSKLKYSCGIYPDIPT
jgi:hypothetical protein